MHPRRSAATLRLAAAATNLLIVLILLSSSRSTEATATAASPPLRPQPNRRQWRPRPAAVAAGAEADRFAARTAALEPVKGGVALICPSEDKSSVACCYHHCQLCEEECKANMEESDRQEDSGCASRKTACYDECSVEGAGAPADWGTHAC